MMNCMWRQRLMKALDGADIPSERTTAGGVRVDVGNRKAIQIDTWGPRFLVSELGWDETGGLVSEIDLAETRNPDELVEIISSLYSEYE